MHLQSCSHPCKYIFIYLFTFRYHHTSQSSYSEMERRKKRENRWWRKKVLSIYIYMPNVISIMSNSCWLFNCARHNPPKIIFTFFSTCLILILLSPESNDDPKSRREWKKLISKEKKIIIIIIRIDWTNGSLSLFSSKRIQANQANVDTGRKQQQKIRRLVMQSFVIYIYIYVHLYI